MNKNITESSVGSQSDGQTAVPMGRDSHSKKRANDRVVIAGQSKPRWSILIISMIAVFCCQPFGLISIVMAVLSYSDDKVGHNKMAASKRCCALWFSIAAFVFTVIAIIIGVIFVAVIRGTVESTISSFEASVNRNGDSRINFNG